MSPLLVMTAREQASNHAWEAWLADVPMSWWPDTPQASRPTGFHEEWLWEVA